MTMVRKQVYITQEQDEKLKRLAEARGQTEAEVVRGALDGLREVTYEGPGDHGGYRIAETAVKEYAVNDEIETGTGVVADLRRGLARQAWQEELAFIRKLAASRPQGGSITRFNRDEVYEERLSKLLH